MEFSALLNLNSTKIAKMLADKWKNGCIDQVEEFFKLEYINFEEILPGFLSKCLQSGFKDSIEKLHLSEYSGNEIEVFKNKFSDFFMDNFNINMYFTSGSESSKIECYTKNVRIFNEFYERIDIKICNNTCKLEFKKPELF